MQLSFHQNYDVMTHFWSCRLIINGQLPGDRGYVCDFMDADLFQ